jgi:glyoxylase-like metal-dependent hydrolase (beta-lactamase superfamily II)
MGVRVRPLECGWLTSDFAGMVSGQTGKLRMPVAAFLVEHPHGRLVFDTGMHPDLIAGSERLRSIAPMFAIEYDERARLDARLAEADVDAASVSIAAVSHLHFDHCGGLATVPNARLFVQRAEWDAAFKPSLVAAGIFNPDDFDLGQDRELLDGERDVFGDGSVRLVPTPGHTAGHQSLLVEGRILLVGDACYCRLALDRDALPAYGHDLERQRQTFAWLRAREAAGIRLVFSHDPDQWRSLGKQL